MAARPIDRVTVVTAVSAVLAEHDGQRCMDWHGEVAAAVADRLGLHEAPPLVEAPPTIEDAVRSVIEQPRRPRRYLFVRQTRWCPPEVAARFDGVIVCTRIFGGGRVKQANRDLEWYRELRARGVEVIGWDWMLPPGTWRPSMAASVEWLAGAGARALVLNVEPRPPSSGEDWRGQHDELHAYASAARDACDDHGLELWATSWALPSSAPTFPWLELLRPAHRAIPQPYEVHGQSGPAYVQRSIAEYTERGARSVIVGRGAHELDDSDADAWRTPAQIAAHRASTPPGADEAWWTPAGDLTRPLAARAIAAIVG